MPVILLILSSQNTEIENIVKIEIEYKLPYMVVKPTSLFIICCPCCRIITNT